MSNSKIFKTSKGYVLTLKPISLDLLHKCEKVWKANEDKSAEQASVAFIGLVAELFEAGIIRFKLDLEQAAQVVLFRAELRRQRPTLRRNIPDFPLYIIFLCGGEYPKMVELAQAIIQVTKDGGPGKEKAKSGFLPFGRLRPVKR